MSDLISREQAIDAMSAWEWQELYLPVHFKQLLEELPSAQEWIPVSERLPENNMKKCVKCFDPTTGRDVYAEEYIVMIDGAILPTTLNWDEEKWFDDVVSYKVIAWQPLPEPWEGGDAE